MKIILILIVLTTFAFASDNGCTDTGISSNPPVSGSNSVTLTVINDWVQTNQVLGLDVWEDGTDVYVLGTDRTNQQVLAYEDGAIAAVLPLYATNTNCFGIAFNNNVDTEVYHTNDWVLSDLYYTEDFGSNWATITNPAGSSGRGMDFDGTDYWSTNADGGGIWRFQPGAAQENLSIPEVPTQPSGLAVFPYNGNIGIAITTYNTHNIYFYQWDGSSLDYMAATACPVAVSSSAGLAYSETDGCLYWSYSDGSNYHLTQLSMSITALQRSSWGSIKASF